MRVLGVDPGLTRCGLGVVDGGPGGGREVRCVAVDVVRTPADAPLATRLLARRRRGRALDRAAPAGRRRRRAGVQPAQRAHGDGHRAGQRGGRAARGPGRAAGRLPHAERGEGRRHRRGPGRQGAGHRHGDPPARARRGAAARPTPPTRSRWRSATAGGRRCWTGWPRRASGRRSSPAATGPGCAAAAAASAAGRPMTRHARVGRTVDSRAGRRATWAQSDDRGRAGRGAGDRAGPRRRRGRRGRAGGARHPGDARRAAARASRRGWRRRSWCGRTR